MTDQPLLPPQNTEAERAVIGACFRTEKALGEVRQILKHNHFYKRTHQLIYKAIEEMPFGEPLDALTIYQQLKRMGTVEDVGGMYYVNGIIDSSYTDVLAKHYAKYVKEAYVARSAITKYNLAVKSLHGEGCDVEKAIGGVLAETFDLYKEIQGSDSDGATGSDLARQFSANLDTWQRVGDQSGLESGLGKLDWLMHGFKPNQLILVAGRPGDGKSALVNTFLRNMSLRRKVKAALFNMEMNDQEITGRLVAAESGIDILQIKTKKGLGENEVGRVMRAVGGISESKIFVYDKAVQTPQSIHAKCRELIAQEGLEIVFVDYLQLMEGVGDSVNDQIGSISRGLKMIAMDLNIPVVALSQLSRAGATGEPNLKHLRGSGSLEQDADIVIFVIKNTEKVNGVDIITHKLDLAKHRGGSIGQLKIVFRPEQTVFENWIEDTPF